MINKFIEDSKKGFTDENAIKSLFDKDHISSDAFKQAVMDLGNALIGLSLFEISSVTSFTHKLIEKVKDPNEDHSELIVFLNGLLLDDTTNIKIIDENKVEEN